MSIPRAVAWTLVAACAALGAVTTEPRAAEPVTRGPYRVLNADLHVHAFPGDGALTPWDLRREAARRGLDVIAITNHNQTLATRLDRLWFPQPPAPLVLMAQELTTPRYHLTVIGVQDALDVRLPVAEAIRAVHARGGLAIAAHPIERMARAFDDEALALVDGVEVAHAGAHRRPSVRAQFEAVYARAVRLNATLAPVGVSDFHFGAPVGSSRTLLLVSEPTAEGVFEAIRAGRTVAVDRTGRTFGRREWVALVTGLARTADAAADRRNSVTVAVAWLSLVFLVTFGRTRNI